MLWPHRWKFLLLASTISLVSVFTGCLGSHGWDYPPPPKGTFLGLTASRPITASLVVLPLNDVRGTEEQVEYWKVAIPLVPSGKTFYDQPETALKPEPVDEVRFNPPRDFSRALADEIREANVFSSVAFADTSTAITSDLVLHGNLRSTRWERDITTYLLGPMGTVFWFIGLPLGKITTNLEMDLQITPAGNPSKVLWNFTMEFQAKEYDGPYYGLEEAVKSYPAALQGSLRPIIIDLIEYAEKHPDVLRPGKV